MTTNEPKQQTFSFPEPTWQNQLIEARKLDNKELEKFAMVSNNNKHFCNECFCCACVVALMERRNRLD